MDSSDYDDENDLLFYPVCSIWFEDEDEDVQAAAILQQSRSTEANGRMKEEEEVAAHPAFMGQAC